MVKKIDWFEIITVSACLLFAVAISLYHLSYEGYLGLTESQWGTVWAISENGIAITFCIILGITSYGILKVLMRYLFVPYFALKLIYHFSCFSGVVLLAQGTWELIWSSILVLLLIVCLVYCLILIRRKNVA